MRNPRPRAVELEELNIKAPKKSVVADWPLLGIPPVESPYIAQKLPIKRPGMPNLYRGGSATEALVTH